MSFVEEIGGLDSRVVLRQLNKTAFLLRVHFRHVTYAGENQQDFQTLPYP